MSLRSFLILTLLIAGVELVSCSSLQEVDKDYLNQPAMDLKQNQTTSVTTPLTQLNAFKQTAASGGCSTCAH